MVDDAGMKITEVVRSDASGGRVVSHSHVKGLGLTASGVAATSGAGLIGQQAAREAAGIAVDLIRCRKMAGRTLLLVGAPGSGKSAIARAISKELGTRVPFFVLSGSEVYSAEVKKSEVLMEAFRRAIGLRIKETKEVYEGEVTELVPEESINPLGGLGKTISSVVVTLKTTKGSKQLKMEPSVYELFAKERVAVGDVIYVEANSGAVKRVGRSDSYATEFDLEAEEYVPLPKGDVHKRKEIVQDVTLHDLDAANARPQGGRDIMSVVNQITRPRKTEITEKLREEVNKIVAKYVEQGTAEIIPGVLSIDEVHMLDLDCFAYLNRALESNLAPIVILATNRGMCDIYGTELRSPHGIPVDLLDRCLIIRTQPYTLEETTQIIALRAETEGVKLEDTALSALAEVAARTSLRYGIQMLTPSSILSKAGGRETVSAQDIKDADTLFFDAKASARLILESGDGFLP